MCPVKQNIAYFTLPQGSLVMAKEVKKDMKRDAAADAAKKESKRGMKRESSGRGGRGR